MPQDLTDVLEEWKCLEEEYQKIQETHRQYLQKLDEISKLQNNCSTSISRQQKRLKDISVQVKQCSNGPSEDVRSLNEIKEKIKTRSNAFFEMEAFLPKKNGLYLNLVLGNVNITLLSKQSKFAYKDEYEKFKLCATVVLLLFSFMCYFFVNHRVCDAILNFLLLWYYCTLTIRESVLITNGSRPDGSLYKAFRNQFLAYSLYQKGFQSWMWKGLTFLLPFLFFGHFWQLVNGFCLFRMALLSDLSEWQVLMCGLCFLILFMGNFFTTVAVVRQKLKSRNQKPKNL